MRRLALLACALIQVNSAVADHGRDRDDSSIQLGPRPFYLVSGMDESPLKRKLLSCANGPFSRSDFSIAHRGAPLQFPEHTKEAYEAGARMGVKHTPELKSGNPARIQQVFGSQESYAQKLIDELRRAGVKPKDAWPQSFDLRDPSIFATCSIG